MCVLLRDQRLNVMRAAHNNEAVVREATELAFGESGASPGADEIDIMPCCGACCAFAAA